MQKLFAYALCSGMACVLAVIYTLLRIDWERPPEGNREVPAASAPADPPHAPPDRKK